MRIALYTVFALLVLYIAVSWVHNASEEASQDRVEWTVSESAEEGEVLLTPSSNEEPKVESMTSMASGSNETIMMKIDEWWNAISDWFSELLD